MERGNWTTRNRKGRPDPRSKRQWEWGEWTPSQWVFSTDSRLWAGLKNLRSKVGFETMWRQGTVVVELSSVEARKVRNRKVDAR